MPKGYHHLTRDQRCQIYALKRRGLAQTIIAVNIGVSQGTISRERCRNKGFRSYRFFAGAPPCGVKRTGKEGSGDCDDTLPDCPCGGAFVRQAMEP